MLKKKEKANRERFLSKHSSVMLIVYSDGTIEVVKIFADKEPKRRFIDKTL